MLQNDLVLETACSVFLALLRKFHMSRNLSSAKVETQSEEDPVWTSEVTVIFLLVSLSLLGVCVRLSSSTRGHED